MQPDQIRQVRQFNRLVTQRVGALQDSYLSGGRPLGEARLIFEIGIDGNDVRDLRNTLSLDSAYLSRLLRSLEAQGLVRVDKQLGDARVRRAVLTGKGRVEFDSYEALSDELAATLLAPLDAAQRARLIAAMADVRLLLDVAQIGITIAPPGAKDSVWCLDQYFSELDARFEGGFDRATGNSLSDADMTPPTGFFLLACRNASPVGCAALLRLDAETAEIKRMWVAPVVRGQGLAHRMLLKLDHIARDAGFRRLRLDTNRALKEAHALYLRHGFVETPRYNDNPYAHHWFEKALLP